jgi:hypothetical protein
MTVMSTHHVMLGNSMRIEQLQKLLVIFITAMKLLSTARVEYQDTKIAHTNRKQ